MATLEQRLNNLASAIGADIKALRDADGSLSSLPTTAKNNLVSAIAEVYAMANGSANQTAINTAINNLRNELRAGASAALDTFAEVAAQLQADESAAAALSTSINNRVRFDAVQTLTVAQQLQACTNIGIGNPDVDLVSAYNTAKA
jgi:hypothetical protein